MTSLPSPGFQTNVSSPLPPTMVSLSRPALTNAGSATPAKSIVSAPSVVWMSKAATAA